jgi:dynein heavy chain
MSHPACTAPFTHPPPPMQLLAEIQRTWAYLESLFIVSEEVTRELPDATQRFARIDADVKGVLRVS